MVMAKGTTTTGTRQQRIPGGWRQLGLLRAHAQAEGHHRGERHLSVGGAEVLVGGPGVAVSGEAALRSMYLGESADAALCSRMGACWSFMFMRGSGRNG
jgi:hypothetical protein